MAAKTTYTVTDPTGATHTRKTARTYTHAVLVRRNGEDTWGVVGFCGRPDLVAGTVKMAASYGYTPENIHVAEAVA